MSYDTGLSKDAPMDTLWRFNVVTSKQVAAYISLNALISALNVNRQVDLAWRYDIIVA